MEPQEELRSARSSTELASLIQRSADEGTLDAETAELMERSVEFGTRTAGEIMTPRVRTHSLEVNDRAVAVIDLARRTGHSRFPVLDDEDVVVGTVHVKHAVALPMHERGTTKVKHLMVRPIFVPDTLRLDPLLALLRRDGFQLAVVLDEYGGQAGIVTLEDVVEEIVGDISDEHDRLGLARPAAPRRQLVAVRPAATRRGRGRHRHRAAGERGLRHRRRAGAQACWGGSRSAATSPRCRCPVEPPTSPTSPTPPCGSPCSRSSTWTACGSTASPCGCTTTTPATRRAVAPMPTGGIGMSSGVAVVVALLLVAGNAFFVGAEFAMISARRSQIEPRAEAGSRAAKLALGHGEHLAGDRR